MQKRHLIGLAGLLALTLSAAACSSAANSSNSKTAGATSAASTASSPTGTPIPVGVIGSFSGAIASSVAGAKISVQAWADSVNASGGIGGHPIKLFIEDDGGNVATSVTEVKSLVEEDHVVAIVGQASGNAAPWADYVKQMGVPVVGGNTASDVYLSNSDFYSVGGNLLANFYGVSAVANKNGSKLGDLYCAELPACASTVTLLQAFGTSTGTDLSYSSKVSASASDFTAPCQGLKSAGVQSYTLGLAAATLKQVAAACAQQGLKSKLILSNVADSTFPSDPAFEGMQVVDAMFPFFDSSNSATKQFQADIKKYAPTLGTPNSPLNSEVTQAYASGKMFEAAVKASGSTTVTAASVIAGLNTFKGETLGGLTVPLTFTPGQPTAHNCYFTYTIQNGAFVAPNGLKTTCAPDAVINAIIAKLHT